MCGHVPADQSMGVVIAANAPTVINEVVGWDFGNSRVLDGVDKPIPRPPRVANTPGVAGRSPETGEANGVLGKVLGRGGRACGPKGRR